MKTLLDVGSEISIITQDFVTNRELWVEPRAKSMRNKHLEITTFGNVSVYSPNYVEVCIRSSNPVKTDRCIIMLVVPSIWDAGGRVDTILGADMLHEILHNWEDRTILKQVLPPQEHATSIGDQIKHLVQLGIIGTMQVLGDELLLMFSRKDDTWWYAWKHLIIMNDPTGCGEGTKDLDLCLAYWQIKAMEDDPIIPDGLLEILPPTSVATPSSETQLLWKVTRDGLTNVYN